jgi:hypothetical protein
MNYLGEFSIICIIILFIGLYRINDLNKKIEELKKFINNSGFLDLLATVITCIFTAFSFKYPEFSYIGIAFTLSLWVIIKLSNVTVSINEKIGLSEKKISKELNTLLPINISTTSTINIAIFDRLVIYMPIFFADTQSYFKQEGLFVNFIPFGNDSLVVDAVKNGNADIGVCDPTVAMEAQEKDLKIIMPICLEAAASMWTLSEQKLQDKISKKESIKIATYPKPSTSYVLAHKYKNILEDDDYPLNLIELKEFKYNDAMFSSFPSLLKSFEQYDLVLLWEPYTKILEVKGKNKVEKWMDFETKKVNFIERNKHNPNEHLVMYSAIVCLEKNNADSVLASKVYKAVSRATIAIYSIKGMEDYKRCFNKHIKRTGSWFNHCISDDSIESLHKEIITSNVSPYVDFDHIEPWGHQLFNNVDLRLGIEDGVDCKLASFDSHEKCKSLFLN